MNTQIPDELKTALMDLGATEDEVEMTVQDMNTLILERFLKEYLARVKPEDAEELLAHTDEDSLKTFLDAHKEKYPPFSENEYKALAEDTWKRYFEAMSQSQ